MGDRGPRAKQPRLDTPVPATGVAQEIGACGLHRGVVYGMEAPSAFETWRERKPTRGGADYRSVEELWPRVHHDLSCLE